MRPPRLGSGTLIVSVEFMGALRTIVKASSYSVELEEGDSVSTLMKRLRGEYLNGEGFLERSNLLVMRNGKEISVLGGLQTELRHGDKVTLIPVSHGG